MIFSCNRKDMLSAIRRVAKAAPAKSKVEAVTGILIQADAGSFEVKLTATDLTTTICCIVDSPVEQSGGAVINARLLTEIFSMLDGQVVTLRSLGNNNVELSGGKAVYVVASLPADRFPLLKLPDMTGKVKVSNIKSLVRQTAFAAAVEGSNPAMRCVKLEIGNNSLRAFGCNGSALSASSRSISSDGSIELLIPSGALSMLAGLVDDKETLEMGADSKYVTFFNREQSKMSFTTRLGEGTYIDVDGLLKSIRGQYEAEVEAPALYSAMEGIANIGESTARLIRIAFRLGEISLICKNSLGLGQTSINAQVYTPTPEEGFCYQTKLLLSCLRPMSGKIRLAVSADGMLLISAGEQTFLQTPTRERAESNVRPKVKRTKAAKKAA